MMKLAIEALGLVKNTQTATTAVYRTRDLTLGNMMGWEIGCLSLALMLLNHPIHNIKGCNNENFTTSVIPSPPEDTVLTMSSTSIEIP